jgi:import inner membrane translocase subunit TIM50
LDFQAEAETESKRTGAKSSKDSLSSIERRRRYLGRIALGVFVIAFGAQVTYMGREWEEHELKDKRLSIENAPSTRWARTTTRFSDLFNYLKEPVSAELLPPPMPAPHGKPYTLLLSIDDLLVTSTWDREHGWRTAKRPGVDYFIAYLSQFYEVVIFTSQYFYTATPIVEKLDPYNMFIQHRLFREATRSVGGQIVKDLSYLNRDLSKVIIVDTHAQHVSLHPENAVIVPKWDGSPGDRGLIALIPFLESIGIYKPPDVRPILQAYQGKDIPLEYAKREAEDKLAHVESWKQKGKGVDVTFSRLFSASSAPSSPVPPTYLEQKRKEAQALYLEEMAFIEKNKGEFERIIEEEKEAMAKQMPDNLFGMLNAMTGGKPPGPEPPKEGSVGDAEGKEAKKA